MRSVLAGLFLFVVPACSQGGGVERPIDPAAGSGTPASSAADAAGPVQVQYVEVPGEREFSGRLIARPMQRGALLAVGLTEDEARARDTEARAQMATFRVNDHVPQTDEYVFEVPPGATENDVARRLLATRAFQYVEPDWVVYPCVTPNDTWFPFQWHHQANRMRSEDGWDLHTGLPSVAVGICDTGLLVTHEDLQLHRLEGYNAVTRLWESQGGDISPITTHGTETTGCAAANGNNGKGVAGVGWDLSHRMLRVSNTAGGSATLSVLQHAARTAAESGDRVASVSYTGADNASSLTTATYIKSIGGLLVWAAGNNNTNMTFGNRDADDLIVVGGTDTTDDKATFSNFGAFVDITAPAVSIRTTSGSFANQYPPASGTSFACPLAAGLCALIWSANPGLSPDEVETILKTSADDLGATGVDDFYGYGRINTYEAMLLAVGGGGGEPPEADFEASTTSGVAPLAVDFTDLSTNDPDSWSWDFGDGGSSSEQNPSHTYATAGDYTVTLTAANAHGDDTETKVDYITVTDPGGFTGRGFIVSKNPDFSTQDRAFTTSDTLYILAWDDELDVGDMKKAQREVKERRRHGQRMRGELQNNGDFSFTAAIDLSTVTPSNKQWDCKARLDDRSHHKFHPRVRITIDP